MLAKKGFVALKCENGDYVIPETFFVFVGYGDDLGSAVNAHNYVIDHRLVATAVSCFIGENERNAYLDGTIVYRPCEEAHHGRPAIKVLSSFALSHRDDAVENWLETVRSEKYPKLPSRFASLFAFGDMDTCRQVSRRYGWDISTVRQFCLADLGPYNELARISRHNMEIVSFLRACDLSRARVDEIDGIARAYWEGEDGVSDNLLDVVGLSNGIRFEPLYEYLIVGVLEQEKE